MTTRRMPDALITRIREAKTIALCSHVSPDGDTMGSALALRLGLLSMGKDVHMFCQHKVPDTLHVLEGWRCYGDTAGLGDKRFDLLLCVDVSDQSRMGDCAELLERCDHTAQIDHHGTNPLYCELNVVDGAAPAVGLLAYALLCQLGVAIDQEIAKCLYAAIATDTGNFAFSSTDEETFEVMAALMHSDLPLSMMNNILFRSHPRCQVELLARALNSMEFHHGGEVTSMVLSLRDFEECGAMREHADTIVNYGLNINGVKMAVLARENAPGSVKMSLRAADGSNVARVATAFGGGGHDLAAGCTLSGDLEACKNQVVDAMVRSMQE